MWPATPSLGTGSACRTAGTDGWFHRGFLTRGMPKMKICLVLKRRCKRDHNIVAIRRARNLQSDGQPALAEPARNGNGRQAVEIPRRGVSEEYQRWLRPEFERRAGRGGGDQQIDIPEKDGRRGDSQSLHFPPIQNVVRRGDWLP